MQAEHSYTHKFNINKSPKAVCIPACLPVCGGSMPGALLETCGIQTSDVVITAAVTSCAAQPNI